MPRKLFFRLKDGFPRVKLCFCVLCVLTYLALIRVSGAKLWGLFVFFLCAAVYLYLPGRFWARVTGMEKVLPEFAVPLGVLLGTGFLAVLYCVSMRLGVLWLLRALPPVLGLLWLVLLRARRKVRGKRHALYMRTADSFHGSLFGVSCPFCLR
ncbi:MAG: hypothetical protein ACLRI7_04620 [Ruthenibacterium lactatiformans]